MKWIFLIVGVFLLSIVSAELIIKTNPMDITQSINEEKRYNVSFQNTFDFDISSFEFSNLSQFTFADFTIPKNSTQNVEFDVKYSNSFYGQIKSMVSFRYLVDIPVGVRTHYINITDEEYGLSDDDIKIRKGDTIIWKNIADGSRAIVSQFGSPTLQINGTFEHLFNEIRTYDYTISIAGLGWYAGKIEVGNETSEYKSHSSKYDKEWVLNMNIVLNPTSLEIINSNKNFTIEYGESDFGQISIKNNGNETAEMVTLSSSLDWISFDKNNINNIDPGQTRSIEYTIVPIVLETNDTDKNYKVEIKIKALNTQEYIENINVFVPFKEIRFDGSDPEYLLKLIENFCKNNPNNVFCSGANSTGNGTIIYKERDIPVNITPTDFFETLKRLQRMEDSSSRTNNDVKILIDMLTREFPSLRQTVNESLTDRKSVV